MGRVVMVVVVVGCDGGSGCQEVALGRVVVVVVVVGRVVMVVVVVGCDGGSGGGL